MSIEVMNAVWKHSRAENRARLVLLAIADHQGEIGAWPSLERLASMVNASVRSVQRDIQMLEALGELRIERQNAPSNTQYKSNLYWVTLPGVTDAPDYDSGVTNAPSGVTNAPIRGDSSCHTNPIEPLLEPNKRNELFDEFWKEYPLKKDKGKAVKAFRSALTRAKFEEIIAGVIGYRNDPTRKPEYTKYPATWLNADAWENAITPSSDSEAAERARVRREKEREASERFLAEQRERERNSAPAPKCKHGKVLAACLPCSKAINV